MSFQSTVQTARMLGKAPNSPEVQAAARAEILRQQQIQQAQSAIQQQQAAEQQRRAAANAAELVKAVDTGDADKVTWTKPAAKTAAAAPTTAATQTTTQPGKYVEYVDKDKLTDIGKLLQQGYTPTIGNNNTVSFTKPKEKTGNPVLDTINTNFDLDNTYISYGQNAQQRAKLLKQSGNSAQQGLADAYLRNDDPKAVGSAAWYEETVGKALSGGRYNLNEKIETGNVVVDALANFGRGVVQVPSSFSRMVTAAGLAVADMAGEAAKGNIELVGQSLASGPGNFAAGTVQAAVEDPAAFAGGIVGSMALGGAAKGVPRVSMPKPTTVKAPGITIKSNTVVIETPLTGKTKTITTETITATRKTPGATGKTVTGKVKTESGLIPASDFIRPGAGKEGVQSITIKTGNIKVETKNRTVETRKVTATEKTATNETSVILPQQGGKITLQNVTNKTTAKVKTSKTIDTRVKKNAELTRATGTGTARVKSNARVRTATETGKKVSDKTMKTRKQESVYSDTERLKTDYLGKDGTIVLLTADKLNKAGRTRKVTAIEKNNGKPETPKNALPGKVKKTPTVEVKKSGGKEDGTTRKAVYAGQKTAVKRTDSTAGKGKSAKSDTLYLSNGKTGTRMKSTTEKISINPRKMTKGERQANIEQARSDAFYARTKEEVAKERRKANSEKARQQMQAPRLPGKTVKDALRENSEKAREAAYISRAKEIKIKNLIKRYGKEEGTKKAIEAGLLIKQKPKAPKEKKPTKFDKAYDNATKRLDPIEGARKEGLDQVYKSLKRQSTKSENKLESAITRGTVKNKKGKEYVFSQEERDYFTRKMVQEGKKIPKGVQEKLKPEPINKNKKDTMRQMWEHAQKETAFRERWNKEQADATKAKSATKTGSNSRSSGGTAKGTAQKQKTAGSGGNVLLMKDKQTKPNSRTTAQKQTAAKVRPVSATQKQNIKRTIKAEMKRHIKSTPWYTLRTNQEDKNRRIENEIKLYLPTLVKRFTDGTVIGATGEVLNEFRQELVTEIGQDVTSDLIRNTTTDTGTTQDTTQDTKVKLKLVVNKYGEAVKPAEETKTTTRQKTRTKAKPVVIQTRKNKKRVLIKDEEWKKKKSKKAPKKGKNAVRLETVNQFGWLGFDAKPPAKPKLLKLQ